LLAISINHTIDYCHTNSIPYRLPVVKYYLKFIFATVTVQPPDLLSISMCPGWYAAGM